ncbi:MAG: rod shape-determining protein RodA [Oscillospiraceae bacterium]|jgi:rod shape determining protein RodA|nr:rod shape-determining protein RodA [Oscillospiraceae bacterium]
MAQSPSVPSARRRRGMGEKKEYPVNATPTLSRRARPHFDVPLLLITYALAVYGVIAVTVATYSYTDETLLVDTLLARITGSYYGSRQGIFFLVSPLAIGGMIALDYKLFQRFSGLLYLASLGLLLLVLVMGATTSGVTGWFNLFSGYMLQPSEFAKIASILQLAKFFARKEDPVTNLRDFGVMAFLMGIPILLIFVQGELGTVMVFLAIYLAMMFVSGMKLRIIAGILTGGVAALIPAVLIMRATGSYRYVRLISFFDPSQATADAILQANNSQIAIGNGGLNGVGLFQNGTYTALNYVPQDHTDFIFSSIGETMGFIGCMAVIVLYALLIFRMLSLAMSTGDKFARLVIVGVLSMMAFHIVYNVGMTIGITPVMGIPLPFMSYGGSNLIANMAGIGLVMNITLRRPQARTGLAAQTEVGIANSRKRKRIRKEA